MSECLSELSDEVELPPVLVRPGDPPTEDPLRWRRLCRDADTDLSPAERAADLTAVDRDDGAPWEPLWDVPTLSAEDEEFLARERNEREGLGSMAIFSRPGSGEVPVASATLAASLDDGFAADVLTERGLVEHVIGFDRLVAWADARRSEYVAELARRQPRLSDVAARDRGGPGGSQRIRHP